MPSSVSTVTIPSWRVCPKLVPTPVIHGSECQLNISTLTFVIFMVALLGVVGCRLVRREGPE